MKITAASHKKIRKLLPKGWRKKLAETSTGITPRQITEVFNQRTCNSEQNKIVWDAVKKIINSSNVKYKEDLIKEVDVRLNYCTSLDNIIH